MEATVSLSLLDVKAAAERTPFAPRTLRKWAKEGRIAAQKVGNQWVFSEQAVKELNDRQAPA